VANYKRFTLHVANYKRFTLHVANYEVHNACGKLQDGILYNSADTEFTEFC